MLHDDLDGAPPVWHTMQVILFDLGGVRCTGETPREGARSVHVFVWEAAKRGRERRRDDGSGEEEEDDDGHYGTDEIYPEGVHLFEAHFGEIHRTVCPRFLSHHIMVQYVVQHFGIAELGGQSKGRQSILVEQSQARSARID